MRRNHTAFPSAPMGRNFERPEMKIRLVIIKTYILNLSVQTKAAAFKGIEMGRGAVRTGDLVPGGVTSSA